MYVKITVFEKCLRIYYKDANKIFLHQLKNSKSQRHSFFKLLKFQIYEFPKNHENYSVVKN